MPCRSRLVVEAVHHRLDRDQPGVEALPPDQILGVGDRVAGRVGTGVEHDVHPVRSERVRRDRRGERRVDAAGQALDGRAEPVLAHVVPHPQHQRPVDLGQVGQPGPDHRRGQRRVRLRRGQRRQLDPLDRHRAAVAGVRALAARGQRGVGGGQVEVGHHQGLVELRPAGQQVTGRRHDDRVAVEDQLVLAADKVRVREHGAGFGRAPLAQRQPRVVLVPLVRRRVRHHQQARAGGPGDCDRPAVLPQVLADRDRDVDRLAALGRQPEHRQRVAGQEVAELVEDAVVGQVVFGRRDRDVAAVQHRGRVQR